MARIEKGRIQISIVDLVRETEKLCGVDNAYSVIHMKKKVQEYFGDSIVLTEQDGKPSVLHFVTMFLPYCMTFTLCWKR